ncbi:hypothetical protein GOP47_0003781 [Adiantum capillus-veneris]|uniref:Serine protease n=1 Tax=Adiantum capillus-veneris TaxID=13818 RepID=A0A9D4V7I9_ADICA|nr:hypothetical protein GOP47_0003781 [Adiantum capillus-veneris]
MDSTMKDDGLSREVKDFISQKISEMLDGGDSLEGDYSSYVAKLFDNDQYIGTFTFLGERIGVTDFHAVFSPNDEHILEESLALKIGQADIKVQHLVSYPHYDISVYMMLGALPPCKYLEIGHEPLAIGDEIMLISFPALGESDCNSKLPVISHGKVEQAVPSRKNSFLVAKYECYAGSSGGPVVLKRTGRLVGIHIGSIFYEDRTYNAPAFLTPRQVDYPVTSGAVRCLSWKPPAADIDFEAMSEGSSNSQEGCEGIEVSVTAALDAFFLSLKDVREVAFYAASNAFRKGHHARFLPALTLKTLISVESFATETLAETEGSTCKHGSRRQELRRKIIDKSWRKTMRKLRRLIRAVGRST